MLVEMTREEAMKAFLKGKQVRMLVDYDDGSMTVGSMEEMLPEEGVHYLVTVPAVDNPEFAEKSGRYRTIYLDEVARYHLQKYISQREDDDPALFVASRKPFGRLHTCGIRNILKQIAKREGMQCRVYPHKLRKTLGMNLKNSGVDLGSIQEILGHSNPAVTSRYYAESTPDTLRSVRKRAIA